MRCNTVVKLLKRNIIKLTCPGFLAFSSILMRLLLLSSPGADLLPGRLSPPPPEDGEPLEERDAPGGPGDLPRSPPRKLDSGEADDEFLRRSSIAANGGFSSRESGKCGRPGGPGTLPGGRCRAARCESGFAPGGMAPAIELIGMPGGAQVTGGNPGCPASDNRPLAIDTGGIPGNPANPGGKPGVPGGAMPGGRPGIPGMPGIPPLAACCFLKKRTYFCNIS